LHFSLLPLHFVRKWYILVVLFWGGYALRDSFSTADVAFMRRALDLAHEAAAEGETPVGCVVVRDGCVVGEGRNRRELGKSAVHHAEIEAIHNACQELGGWRLWQCVLYVTLEPCPMCAGAIINARIPRVVFGANDPKAGCCGSVTDLFALPFNHRASVYGGCLADESAVLLQEFFRQLRNNRLL
jgi:tRNA(adenine34) deaminase